MPFVRKNVGLFSLPVDVFGASLYYSFRCNNAGKCDIFKFPDKF